VLLFPRVKVGDLERAIVITNGRFRAILEPGVHWIGDFWKSVEIERHKVSDLAFHSVWAAYLIRNRPDLVERHFLLVETTDSQVALVSIEGKLTQVIGPGRRVLYWRGPLSITAQVIDALAEPEVPAKTLAALGRLGRDVPVVSAHVDEGKTGLLFVDNRYVRSLAPGAYAFWTAAGMPRIDVVDLRLQTQEIAGQEILTADKVSIRVNIWTQYQVIDPVRARTGVSDYANHLYRIVQLAVRQTLGRRTLEQVLAEKTDIDESVAAEVRREMETFGVRVGAIALKDIVLPGEVRDILNQVVTAEKQAQANLIRRREETAATRSLLNTAKLMEGNPLLVRLKELETLEKVAEKVEKISISGGFDSLLQELVTLGDKRG
jgi:regulator of protease activity HflC (stomatin/prohibitin superfamily)